VDSSRPVLLVLLATALACTIGYQIYLNVFVYTDDKPTRHDLAILADAEDGNAHAQYLMGVFVTTGRQGIEPDPDEARRWFEAAAAQGYPDADYRLGDLYRRGDGVAKDIDNALGRFRRAAEGGSRAAQNALGDLYRTGEGVEAGAGAAVEWYSRAADAGFAPAQRNMGIMAASGEGVPQDFAVALDWYRKAALDGDAIALNNLGIMYEHGQAVPVDPVRAWACYYSASLAFYVPARKRRDALGAKLTSKQHEYARSMGCVESPTLE
jgi:TPR repeat protein